MIEAVILYSTNDSRFIYKCIDNLVHCDIKCNIITYSHMWNGSEEDSKLINELKKYYKTSNKVSIYSVDWTPHKSAWYWEGLGRYLGTQQVSENTEYILYIDSDEIVEADKFKKWLQSEEYAKYDSVKLCNYWYWREPIYRADTLEDSVVLVQSKLAKSLRFSPGGRDLYFISDTKPSLRYASKHSPFIHHFSWVRTEEQMLKKVTNWGHRDDKVDWIQKVREEFSREFNGRDFVNGYEYSKVPNHFNI